MFSLQFADLQSLFEIAPDAIVAMDHTGVVTGFNAAAEQTFGYTREEAIGRPLADLIIPTTLREAHREGLQRYLATGEGRLIGKSVELTSLRSNGTEFPAWVRICRIPGSDPPMFVGFVRDLTEPRRADKRIRDMESQVAEAAIAQRSEERFRRLLEMAPDAAIIVDSDGHIVLVNAQTEKLFGYPRAELIGQTVEMLVPMEHREKHVAQRRGFVNEARARPMGLGLALFGRRKDGSEVPVEISLGPIPACPSSSDQTGCIIATIRDITERRILEETQRALAQEQNARAAALASVRIRDDFVAIAGHELRTPLTAVLMQLQSLQRQIEKAVPADLAGRVDKATRSALRIDRLVSQLLDISRINAGRLQLEPVPFNLADLVREVLERFADASEQSRCPIVAELDDRADGVWDRNRVDQIVTNLVSNAVKYGKNNPIKVSVDAEQSGKQWNAVLRVTDHGIGISEEHLKKIFERFERVVSSRDFGGFGLGLWITRQIVEAINGTIEVESEPNRGSTFTICLPMTPPVDTESEA